MKLTKLCAAAILAAIVFASCASKPAPQTAAPVTAAEAAPAQPNNTAGEGMRVEALQSTIIDWSNRSLGEDAQPVGLRQLVKNKKQDVLRQEYNIADDDYVYFNIAKNRNLENARFDAEILGAQRLAHEFKTYVMTAASRTMSEGSVNRLEELTRATKVNIAGNRQLVDFWQRVRTVDKGSETEEYHYYVVYRMDSNSYRQLLAKYLFECTGELPESNEKRNIRAAFEDIDRESRTRVERSDAEFRQELQLQMEAARADQQRQMAQINRGAARDESMARVAQSQVEAQGAAQSAANRYGTAAQSAISSTTSADIDWIEALSASAL